MNRRTFLNAPLALPVAVLASALPKERLRSLPDWQDWIESGNPAIQEAVSKDVTRIMSRLATSGCPRGVYIAAVGKPRIR